MNEEGREYFGVRDVSENIDSLSLPRPTARVQRRRGGAGAGRRGDGAAKHSSKARPRGPSAAQWLAGMERVRQCKQTVNKLR